MQIPIRKGSGIIGNLSVMEHPHGGIICIVPIKKSKLVVTSSYYYDETAKKWTHLGEPLQYLSESEEYSQVTFLNLMGNLQSMQCTNGQLRQDFSYDYGKIWKSVPKILEEDVIWEVQNRPIFMQMGRVLLPIYDKASGRSFAYISDDTGKNWFPSVFIEPSDEDTHDDFVIYPMTSPTFILAGERMVICFIRSEEDKQILKVTSEDLGETWYPAESTGIPSSSGNIDSIRLLNEDGIFTPTIIILYSEDREINGKRTSTINVAISSDIGESWENQKIDECDDRIKSMSIIQTRDTSIHILYSTRTSVYHLAAENLEIE